MTVRKKRPLSIKVVTFGPEDAPPLPMVYLSSPGGFSPHAARGQQTITSAFYTPRENVRVAFKFGGMPDNCACSFVSAPYVDSTPTDGFHPSTGFDLHRYVPGSEEWDSADVRDYGYRVLVNGLVNAVHNMGARTTYWTSSYYRGEIRSPIGEVYKRWLDTKEIYYGMIYLSRGRDGDHIRDRTGYGVAPITLRGECTSLEGAETNKRHCAGTLILEQKPLIEPKSYTFEHSKPYYFSGDKWGLLLADVNSRPDDFWIGRSWTHH